jgi:hypothetical protein
MFNTFTTRTSQEPLDRPQFASAVLDLLDSLPRERLLPARVRGLLPGHQLLLRLVAGRGDADVRFLARVLHLPRHLVDVPAVRAALAS